LPRAHQRLPKDDAFDKQLSLHAREARLQGLPRAKLQISRGKLRDVAQDLSVSQCA
jgi:ribosomal protein S14